MKLVLQMLLNWVLSQVAPPDFKDSAAVRAWILKIAGLLGPVVEKSPWPRLVAAYQALVALVQSEESWAKLWAFIQTLLVSPADNQIVKGDVAAVAELAQAVGIDPATILLIVQTIISLIQQWRKK